MDIKEFKENIFTWSTVRGIYANLTWQSQLKLYSEECLESYLAKDDEELKMEMGDRLVCLINCLHMHKDPRPEAGFILCTTTAAILARNFKKAVELESKGITDMGLDLSEVLGATWEKIKNRRGMVFGDKYIKESSMTKAQLKQWKEIEANHAE